MRGDPLVIISIVWRGYDLSAINGRGHGSIRLARLDKILIRYGDACPIAESGLLRTRCDQIRSQNGAIADWRVSIDYRLCGGGALTINYRMRFSDWRGGRAENEDTSTEGGWRWPDSKCGEGGEGGGQREKSQQQR